MNTFYFQYGHRSIADLAHVAFAIERLSLLAAIILVDEQRWDGQERSTRYQNFRKSGWYLPDFAGDSAARGQFSLAIEALFAEYHTTAERIFDFLKERTPKPAEMKEEAYARTLRARAFDVARYLLPAGHQYLARPDCQRSHAGIPDLPPAFKPPCRNPPTGRTAPRGRGRLRVERARRGLASLTREIAALDPSLGARAEALLTREVKTAPTLVKYAAASEYALQTRRELAEAAAALLQGVAIEAAPIVDLLEDETLEIEVATTLLYGASHHPYRQIRSHVAALSQQRRDEIVSLGARHRGRYDELLREFSSGHALRFDILMDIGGFRDMHRHRRCIQILQSFTNAHGYDLPDAVTEAGIRPQYDAGDGTGACVLSSPLRRRTP